MTETLPHPRLAYTVKEFCAAIPMHRATFYRLVERGEIEPFHVGASTYIDVDEARDFIRRQKEKTRAARTVT